jgi:hypothetical protein
MDGGACWLILAALVVIFIWAAVAEANRRNAIRAANEAKLNAIGEIAARIDQTIVLFANPPRIAVRQPFVVNGQVVPPERAATRIPAAYEVHPVDENLTVSTDTDGNVTPASASSTSVGVGPFRLGETSIQSVDKREIFLALVSDTWSHVEKFEAEMRLDVRKFAAQVTQVVKRLKREGS